jgi:hypothetical protein
MPPYTNPLSPECLLTHQDARHRAPPPRGRRRSRDGPALGEQKGVDEIRQPEEVLLEEDYDVLRKVGIVIPEAGTPERIVFENTYVETPTLEALRNIDYPKGIKELEQGTLQINKERVGAGRVEGAPILPTRTIQRDLLPPLLRDYPLRWDFQRRVWVEKFSDIESLVPHSDFGSGPIRHLAPNGKFYHGLNILDWADHPSWKNVGKLLHCHFTAPRRGAHPQWDHDPDAPLDQPFCTNYEKPNDLNARRTVQTVFRCLGH